MDSPSNLSYLHTPSVKPYNYTTVPRVANQNARLRPNQELFIHRELDGSRSSLSNASLYEKAEHLAKYLVTQGIQKGDMVAMIGPNTLEMIVGMLGIMSAGAVALNITINMKTALDAKEILALTKAKCLLVDCGKDKCLLSPVKAVLEHCNVQTDTLRGDNRINVVFMRKFDLDNFRNTATLETIQSQDMINVQLPHIYPEDNALTFTTSGSSGKPKMALHSHFSLASSPLCLIPPTVAYEPIVFNDRPFAWAGGSPVFNILRSETRVFMDTSVTSRDSDFVWQILKAEGCTNALLMPFAIHDLLELPQTVTDDGFRLHQVVTGGQMIDNYYTQVTGRFCHKMMIIYACTEGSGIAYNWPIDRTGPLEAGDVCRPYPGVEIRVVDLRNLPIERELIGKIQIRSPTILKEYVGSPQLTEEAFTEDRWFRTGDIGKVSSDGRLILLGRESDAIKRGTRKIYPAMLEFLLKKMESIKDVCVVPVPDKRLYEEICVCFVPAGPITPDDVQQYCEQNLFKENTVDSLGEMPTYFLLFEMFPKLANGKLDKRGLTTEATLRLGLKAARDSNI